MLGGADRNDDGFTTSCRDVSGHQGRTPTIGHTDTVRSGRILRDVMQVTSHRLVTTEVAGWATTGQQGDTRGVHMHEWDHIGDLTHDVLELVLWRVLWARGISGDIKPTWKNHRCSAHWSRGDRHRRRRHTRYRHVHIRTVHCRGRTRLPLTSTVTSR